MNYEDFIADFAERTLKNLDHIQALASAGNEDLFPVTQLWNSLLGLVVLPRERDIKRIPRRDLEDLTSDGWTFNGGESRKLRDIVLKLRNAVSHFNVEFMSGPEGQITSVTVWNERLDEEGKPIKGSRGWQGHLTVAELDRVARLIAEVYVRKFAATSA